MALCRARTGLVLPIAALIALVACSGGETVQQFIDRYRPAMESYQQRLAAIHASIPQTRPALEAKLDPPPSYMKESGNVEILAMEQLLDPYVRPTFDLMLSRDLLRCLSWTGSQSKLLAEVRRKRDASFHEQFDRALANRYLVVIRSRGMGVEVTGETYQGGWGEVEAFVFDLETDTLVATTYVSASPDTVVQFQVREGEDAASRGRSAVHSSTWVKLRSTLTENLAAVTGGSFVF
jgi:hypothetical protein